MDKVSVCIATYGNYDWSVRGDILRIYTEKTSGADQVVHVHSAIGLAEARNRAVKYATGEYIVILDADDRLAPDYCGILKECLVDGDVLYKPSVSDFHGNNVRMLKEADMFSGNELVIGTPMRRDRFPGFDTKLEGLEDWDLFLRMIIKGASIKSCPELVYRIGGDGNGRNSIDHTATAKAIRSKYRQSRTSIRRLS